MSDFSIAQAKAQFANLVQQAEAGRAVRITRRGRSVAVVVSDAEYIRLSAQFTHKDSLFDFTTRLRQEAAQAGQELLGDEELTGLRDDSERSPQTDWR
jgi:prevent-host-death family protein